MKFTIWAPDFKDLPTIHIQLPTSLTKKGMQILYGYTQPSKPYDKTLFLHLITPVKTSRSELRKLTIQLRNLVKRAWDKSHYHIIHIDEDYKAYQSFIYFQLKREKEVISSRSLSSPLEVKRPVEKKVTKKKSSVKRRKHAKPKKATKRKATRRKVSKKRTSKRKKAKRKLIKRKTPRKKAPSRKKVAKKRRRR